MSDDLISRSELISLLKNFEGESKKIGSVILTVEAMPPACEIEDAIKLLRTNGYMVKKIPDKLCSTASECCKYGTGECMDCSCFVCLLGIE